MNLGNAMDGLVEEPKEEEKKKGGNVKLVIILIAIFVLAVIGSIVYYQYYYTPEAVISMTSPKDGEEKLGPIVQIDFSADKKIKVADITKFSVKNADYINVLDGKFSATKGKVKTFSWKPEQPLRAGTYDVLIDGDKVRFATFTIKVFEVGTTGSSTLTPAAKVPVVGESAFLKQLKENMKAKDE